MTNRRLNWKLVLLLSGLFLTAAIRLLHLSADSPQGPFWLFDEGNWVHNARNAILFHRWVTDEFNQGLVTPVFTGLTYLSFHTFGVGLVQARFVSALMGVLTLLVFYHWLKTTWTREEAGIATLLLGTNAFLFDYNRLALPETTVVFFLVLAGCLWAKSAFRPYFGMAAGFAFLLACLTKPTAVFFFPIPAIVWLLKPGPGQEQLSTGARLKQLLLRPHRDPLGLFLLGCALVALAGIGTAAALHLLPNASKMLLLLAWRKRPKALAGLAFRFIALPARHFFRFIPGLLLLSAVYFMLRAFKKAQGRRFVDQCTSTELIALAWLGLSTAFLAASSWYADRYMIVLIPPLCILGARAIAEFASLGAAKGAPTAANVAGRTWLKIAVAITLFVPFLSILWAGFDYAFGDPLTEGRTPEVQVLLLNILEKLAVGTILLGMVGLLAFWRYSRRNRESFLSMAFASYPTVVLCWAALSVGIYVIGYAIPAGAKDGLSMRSSGAVAVAVTLGLAVLVVGTSLHKRLSQMAWTGRAMLLAAVLLVDGTQILSTLLQPTYDVFNAGTQLSQQVGDRKVILGDLADSLAMGSTAVSVRAYLGMNKNAFERFHPDYIVDFREKASAKAPHELMKAHPPVSFETHFVQRFCLLPLDRKQTLFTYVVDLYSVDGPKETDARYK